MEKLEYLYYLLTAPLPGLENASQGIAPLVLAGIVAGVSAITSGIIQSRASKKQMQRTNAANLELAKYESSANEALIDKQNAYNTPAMQMGRFDQAGLNPNLMYGQGSSGNQAQPARYDAPTVDMHFTPFQIPEMLSNFQDYEMKAAQIDNVKAATESTRTEIGNKLLDRMLTSVNTGRKQFDLSQAKLLAPYSADIKHYQAQAGYSKLLQEFSKVDQSRLKTSLMQQQLKGGAVNIDNAKENLLYNQLKNQMFKKGVTPSDNILLRLLVRSLSNMDVRIDQGRINRDLHVGN